MTWRRLLRRAWRILRRRNRPDYLKIAALEWELFPDSREPTTRRPAPLFGWSAAEVSSALTRMAATTWSQRLTDQLERQVDAARALSQDDPQTIRDPREVSPQCFPPPSP